MWTTAMSAIGAAQPPPRVLEPATSKVRVGVRVRVRVRVRIRVGASVGPTSSVSSAGSTEARAMPRWSKAVKSATGEVAGSSTRGGGWECRAAQSRQARPEEAQEPTSGTAKEAL